MRILALLALLALVCSCSAKAKFNYGLQFDGQIVRESAEKAE